MTGYNKVILMGNLTRDPTSGTLPSSGAAVCEFALAVNRRWKDADGNLKEEVLFMDCTAYGKPAEALGRYLRKGRPVHVEGRLKLDRWEQDGQPRTKVRVVVEQFRFVDAAKLPADGPPDDPDSPPPPPPKRPGGAGAARPRPRTKVPAPAAGPAGPDGDIPF